MYLSGSVHDNLPPEVGVMLTPQMGNRLPEDRTWAADTGMFAAPEKFDPVHYLRWLAERRAACDRCLFATAPDVMGDARATLRRARPMLPVLRALGYRAALVAQPGLERLTVPWDEFDVLFVGGGRFKWSPAAFALAAEAKRRGKGLHWGGANSLRTLQLARSAGYDSADGTFVAFGPDQNIPRLRRWLDALARQPPLFTLHETGATA